jgi:UDPglucose 6-dehydrogenase
MKPDRVVIGVEDPRATELMLELYAPFTRTGAPIMVMDCASAELTKYAANAMLATRISFMNEVANVCESVGADVDQVRRAVGSDRRIGTSFLFPGVGYGGSCFPKDVKAMMRFAEDAEYDFRILKAVEAVNVTQKTRLAAKMKKHFGSLKGKTVAVWGLAFKPKTDDMREAPSIALIESLLTAGAAVQVYDPGAMGVAKNSAPASPTPMPSGPLKAPTRQPSSPSGTSSGADWERVRTLMKTPVISTAATSCPGADEAERIHLLLHWPPLIRLVS